jgi:hypothetical protein
MLVFIGLVMIFFYDTRTFDWIELAMPVPVWGSLFILCGATGSVAMMSPSRWSCVAVMLTRALLWFLLASSYVADYLTRGVVYPALAVSVVVCLFWLHAAFRVAFDNGS